MSERFSSHASTSIATMVGTIQLIVTLCSSTRRKNSNGENFGNSTFFPPLTKSGNTLVPLPCASEATCSITSAGVTKSSLA